MADDDKEKTPTPPVHPGEQIIQRNIEDEMKSSYIDYSMSVIVGRALPDVRDGLKPVHRRILFAMKEMGLLHNRAYKKSARVVGDVLGKYHPHGDMAVYDAMVRMVQEFSLRHPLVDGQGNFGSVDGDSAAAMRYTEVRLAGIADEILADIDKETVDFGPNYDDSMTEPLVLPGKLPNLLVNGSSGIAVGMATNIPPHNLGETCDAVMALIDNPNFTSQDALKIMKGPDFPTAAIITGRTGIKDYFETGRGSVRIRAKTEIEEIRGGREAIIVTELPYQVNKATLLSTIADLVRDKKIEDISDLRDESDRDGIRMMIEIKRDGNAQIVLNQLFKHTQLEISFGVIMLALVDGKPKVLGMRDMLFQYVEHRKDVVVRRTRFELKKAEERAHILEGLRIAIDNLNKIIKLIRESKDQDEARVALMQEFGLSRLQSQAILDMRLHQLTGLERKKLEEEYLSLIKLIAKLKSILGDPKKVLEIVKAEVLEIKEKYADERRTKIQAQAVELEMEDLIHKEDVVVTISHAGYTKRLPVTTYRAQRRGGKGVTGMTTREEDFVESLFVTSTHSYMLFFTNKGRVYWLKVYEIPEVGRAGKGKALVNLIQIASSTDERITAAVAVEDFEKQKGCFLTMATLAGTVKKTSLEEFANPRRGGIIAINLDKEDELIAVQLTDGKQELVVATREGQAIRFEEEEIRVIGRPGKGVRGIRLNKDDRVIGMEIVSKKDSILTATENGFGKRTEIEEYRKQSRGGKGVINMKITEKTGITIGIKRVNDEDDIVLMTARGQVVRMAIKSIREIGRNTQGVRLIRLEEGDKLSAMAYIVKEDEDTSASVTSAPPPEP